MHRACSCSTGLSKWPERPRNVPENRTSIPCGGPMVAGARRNDQIQAALQELDPFPRHASGGSLAFTWMPSERRSQVAAAVETVAQPQRCLVQLLRQGGDRVDTPGTGNP